VVGWRIHDAPDSIRAPRGALLSQTALLL
jgi:hypothetical protein